MYRSLSIHLQVYSLFAFHVLPIMSKTALNLYIRVQVFAWI